MCSAVVYFTRTIKWPVTLTSSWVATDFDTLKVGLLNRQYTAEDFCLVCSHVFFWKALHLHPQTARSLTSGWVGTDFFSRWRR